MNKIININLGGYPFQIDDDAYENLKGYLSSIHQYFGPMEGYEEITGDIETRLAELFQEELGSRPIVTKNDVQAAIAIMGMPEEFGAEPEEAPSYSSSRSSDTGIKTGKRLFRNPDEKVLGGVCSGLSAYFGISDPLWIRLILLVLTLTTAGFLAVAYILLWIIVPEATTASDRLAMRGEAINVENIGRIIGEEIEELPKRFSEAGETISKSFRSQKKNLDGTGAGIRGFINKVFGALTQILRALLRAIGFIWKPLLMIVSFVLAIILIATWTAGAFSLFMSMPLANYILPDKPWLVLLGYTNIFMVVGIPLLVLLLLAVRGWTKFRMNNYWRAGLGAFWLMNIFSFISIGTFTARQFHAGVDLTGQKSSFSMNADTLYLRSSTSKSANNYLFRVFGDDELVLTDDHLLVDDVDIDIVKSDNNQFQTQMFFFSRGNSEGEAERLIEAIDFPVEKNGNTWTFPTQIKIPSGEKYRGQQVRYRIAVPEGKSLAFDRGIRRSLERFERTEGGLYNCWDCDKHIWTMSADGFTRPETEEEREYQENFSFPGYTKLQLEGRMNVEIEQSEEDLNVEVIGGKKGIVRFDKLNNTLYISSEAKSNSDMLSLRIKAPELSYILAKNTRRDVKIRGFEQQKMTIEHEGKDRLDAFISVDSLTILQTDESDIDLRGEGQYLEARLEKSKLDAERYFVKSANIRGIKNSRFILSVEETLYEALSPNSSVRYHREPATIKRDTL